MDSRSDFVASDNGAFELATVVFEGREFTSGGFHVDVESGRMLAYVKEADGAYWLTTWEGTRLAKLARTDAGRWYTTMGGGRQRGGSIRAFGEWLMAFRTLEPIAGYHWYGRGLGPSMCLRLRRGRKAE